MGFPRFFCKVMDKLADGQQNKRKCTEFKELNFKENKDIVYFEDAKDACTLDTLVLNDGKVHPVCLLIHGGSFVAGDKYYRRALTRWLAYNNYFVININYGLGPKYPLHEQVKHIGKSIEWMEENASKFNYDLSNAIVYGDSAGGYHAAIACLFTTVEDFKNKYNIVTNVSFKKAVLICGIYDLNSGFGNKWYLKLIRGSLQKDILHTKKMEDYKGHDELLNLLNWIPSSFPQTFVSFSEKDLLCGGQTQLLIKKLEELNIDYDRSRSTKFADNHCYSLSWMSEAAQKCNNRIKEFIG